MNMSAPLTKTQYGLYVECVSNEGKACYNIPYCYTLDGSLNGERLCRAIETAVAAHPTLFTRIAVGSNDEPVQSIDREETFTPGIEEIDDIEAAKASFVQPFSLLKDRLFRIRLLKDKEHFYLLQDIHHIISDGTSRKVLLDDIRKAYNGEPLEPEALALGEVAEEEAKLRTTPAFEEGKQWYAQNFDCGDCCSPLLPDIDGTAATEPMLTRTMQTDMARVDALCRKNGLFKNTFFTAVYAYLLAKFNNEQQALFSSIHNGRSDRRLAHSVAMLVKTFPVYAQFTEETSVLDFLKACQEQMSGCREHEAYSYSDAVSDLGLQVATMFAWHGNLFDSREFCGKPMCAERLNNNTLEVPLYVKGYLRDGRCCIEAEYSSEVYSTELVSQFLESYEAVAEDFLSKEFLREIDLSTASQRDLLDRFNETDIPYDDTQTIVSLFRRQAKATPGQIAVVFKDRQYTYAEVDDISDRIAATLAAKGLGAEDVVSILIPRCEWMVIASLGVSKAGCAYQPLDPSYPKERLNFMMQDAGAQVLIADEALRPIVDDFKGDVLLTKDLTSLPAAGPVPEGPKPGSLFILLYTSGSTGVPKGCQLMHSNLVCFCHWYQRYFDLKPGHKVAAYASYGFDVCMMDMYCGITCGVPIYIIPQEMRLDLVALNDYFEQEAITHAFITTQVAYQFATSMENHSLLHLCTAGEKLAPLAPPKGYRLHNGYGPTETTVLTTIYRVDEKLKDIPIGKPLDNLRLYIVDGRGQRLPVGAVGELWVAGPQVSRGYLNRPEKTAEVYIANPFTDEEKFSRIYKTGDIVRYLPSGDIQFIGRCDGQVKIRGFRIELKEVEAVIRDFPGIKDATVQAFDEENGSGKFIAAYIVSDQSVDVEALNNFILEQKPPYMVPAVTMQIDAIPLNQNFKVNKRALPKPEKKVEAVEATAAPMSLLQTELFEMIAAIAGNREFGVTTILGKVGLTSISAIKLAVQAKKRFGVSLDATTLVKNGTLQGIENEIYRQVLSGNGAQTAAKADGMPADAQGADGTPTDTPQAGVAGPVSVPLSYAQTGVYFDC
ncbi:MAG: amino acid adenylation domain-containing protein, partial [Bacteroidales bacterium]|nr:amino acid adenylation domain-containing protein [Bacteroidales bacterium]